MAFLEIKNLYKNFGKSQILKGIDFSMEKGEVIAVIGSSGSGKTTFLRCVNFLEEIDRGKITVGGKTVFDSSADKKLTAAEIREHQLNFGLVFQSFNLFPQYSALENVTLAPKLLAKEKPDFKSNKKEIFSQIEENAKNLLIRVGLADRMNLYPFQLSGGQQQRVSIARALALDPKVLFFDEPTSALDPELTVEILKVIKDLAAKKMTMVIVTHEIEFAANVADRIAFMADGVILDIGTPDEIIRNPRNEKIKAFLRKMNEN